MKIVRNTSTWLSVLSVFLVVICGPARAASLSEVGKTLGKRRTYQIKVMKRSAKGDVYIFKDENRGNPEVDEQLFLWDGLQLIGAVKVLKTFPNKAMFIARVDRSYNSISTPRVGDGYKAYGDESSGDRRLASVGSNKFVARAGLGFSSFSYKETAVEDFSMIGVDALLTLGLNLNRFHISSRTAYTVQSFDSNLLVDTKLFSTGILFGYDVTNPLNRFSLTLNAGWFYRTTMVTEQAFGFRNVTGIQLFPFVRFRVKPKHSLTFFLSYSPIMDRLSLLGFSNRELALGAGWEMLLGAAGRYTLALGLGYNSLEFTLADVQVSATSIGATAQFGF